MVFFIEKKHIPLMTLEKGVKDLREKLSPLKAFAEYVSLSSNLKNHLEKEERKQRTRKN